MCLVGAGLIWESAHRHNIDRLASVFTVAGVCARNVDTRAPVVKAYPDAREISSLEQLFSPSVIDQFDALLVLTPIALNAPVAVRALEAGKIVFLEKPAAMSLSQCTALESAAAASSGRLYILENHYYDERVGAATGLVKSGRIGTPVGWERTAHFTMGGSRNQAGPYGASSWRMHADFPLGIMFDGGIHDLAGMRSFSGAVDTVFASGRSLREEFGEYDLITTQVQYKSGVIGSFSHSAALPRNSNYTIIRGTEGTITFTEDGLRATDAEGNAEDLPVEGRRSHDIMWDEIAQAVAEDRESRYTVAEGLADVRTLLAVERSIKTKRAEFVGG